MWDLPCWLRSLARLEEVEQQDSAVRWLRLLRLFGENDKEEWLLRALGVTEGELAAGGWIDSGEVAAEWCRDELEVGLSEHRAIDDDESEEQWRGVTHVEQVQQQLHCKV